jgi:hypothetical protein
MQAEQQACSNCLPTRVAASPACEQLEHAFAAFITAALSPPTTLTP